MGRPEIRIALTDDGMGDGATRADAESLRDFYDSRLTTMYPACDVTVDLLRAGEVTSRPVVVDESEHQDVSGVLATLWEEFCAATSLWPSTRAAARNLGARGGKARALAMTATQRSEASRKAAQAPRPSRRKPATPP